MIKFKDINVNRIASFLLFGSVFVFGLIFMVYPYGIKAIIITLFIFITILVLNRNYFKPERGNSLIFRFRFMIISYRVGLFVIFEGFLGYTFGLLLGRYISEEHKQSMIYLDILWNNPIYLFISWLILVIPFVIGCLYLKKRQEFKSLNENQRKELITEINKSDYWFDSLVMISLYLFLLIMGVFFYNLFRIGDSTILPLIQHFVLSMEFLSFLIVLIIPIFFLKIKFQKQSFEDRKLLHITSIPRIFMFYTLFFYVYMAFFIVFRTSLLI